MSLQLLLVEKNTFFKKSIVSHLAQIYPGCTVKETSSGKTALELLRNREFGMVLLSQSTEDLSAIDILDQIYNSKNGLTISPVVMLLEDGQEHRMHDFIDRGVDHYVAKNYASHATMKLSLLQAERSFTLKKSLWRANKLLNTIRPQEGMGEILSSVTHDFNNVLTVVLGNARLLIKTLQQENLHTSEDILKRVYPVEKAAMKGMDLVKGFTSLAKHKSAGSVPGSIAACLEGMKEKLKNVTGEEADITIIPSDDLWAVQIDAEQLQETLVNMASSGDYLKSKDRKIMLEAENIKLDKDYAMLHDHARPGQYVMITLSHMGGKSRGRLLQYILYPVFSKKKLYDMKEDGLSQVYNFVRQSDGYIHIYSEKGIGTAFRLYLPRSIEESNETFQETSDSGNNSLLPKGSEHVLVVEDDQGLADLAASMLQDLGYTAHITESAVEALDVLKNEKIDVVFTDIILQEGMNGTDLARVIKRTMPNMKILFTSGFTRKSMPQDWVFSDQEFISKPYHKENLAHKLREILDDRGDIQDDRKSINYRH